MSRFAQILPHLRKAVSAALLLGAPFVPGLAVAEGLSGYLEYNYSLLDTSVNDTTGTTKTKSSSFNQRYNLALDRSIYPTLRLSATTNVELNNSDNETDGLSSSSTSSRISPTIDLGYSNGLFGGGVGFSRRMESSSSNGVAIPTTFFDTYNARLNWKPQDLPSFDLLFSTFNNYDEQHARQDTSNTTINLSSRYKPFQGLELTYSGNHSTLTDRLGGFETTSLNQSLRASYNDVFLKDRLALSTSYNIATQNTNSQNHGSAPAQFLTQRLIDQLYFATTAVTADVATTPNFQGGALNPNAVASVNGIAITTAGLSPIRNNFGIQVNLSAISMIRMPVTITTTTGRVTAQDYIDIANAFGLGTPATSKVKIYQSPASDGTNWKSMPGVAIIFGQLTNPALGTLNDGFQITLNETVAAGTIIKVEIESIPAATINAVIQKIVLATPPPPPALQQRFPEAFLQESTPLQPGQSRSSSQLSGLFDVNLKAQILKLDATMVYFDTSFNLTHTKSDTTDFTYRYFTQSGLSLNHRFNQVFSSTARLAREDSVDPFNSVNSTRSANTFSASLSANPLPTLNHSLNYSARQERDSGITKTTHSVNLSNSLELYRGLSTSLNLSGSMASSSTGQEQKSAIATVGVNMVPHKTVSLNLSLSNSQSWNSGGPEGTSDGYTRNADFAVTYNPLQSIYLFAAYTVNAQNSKPTQTAQSIGGSWSPFRDGALLTSISLRESLETGTKSRTIVESIRWNIRPNAFLDLSHLTTTSSDTTSKNDTESFSSLLRIGF